MMVKKSLLLICMLICLQQIWAHPSEKPSQSAVFLQLNLKKGEKYNYNTKTNQLIKQEVMGSEMTIKQQIEVGYLYDVIENDATGLHIKTTYQNIALHMEMPQKTLDYDSENNTDETNPLKNLGNLTGKSFDMYVSPEGRVTKVEGLQDILNSIGGDAATQQLLKQQFGDSAFIHMMDAALNIYPNKKVKTGETWQKNSLTPVAGMMNMALQSTYTLKSVSHNQANIDVQSNIQLSPLSNSSSPVSMEFHLQGTQQGNMQTDVLTGLVANGTIHQDISGEIVAQGMKIPMHITSEISITGKKLE